MLATELDSMEIFANSLNIIHLICWFHRGCLFSCEFVCPVWRNFPEELRQNGYLCDVTRCRRKVRPQEAETQFVAQNVLQGVYLSADRLFMLYFYTTNNINFPLSLVRSRRMSNSCKSVLRPLQADDSICDFLNAPNLGP